MRLSLLATCTLVTAALLSVSLAAAAQVASDDGEAASGALASDNGAATVASTSTSSPAACSPYLVGLAPAPLVLLLWFVRCLGYLLGLALLLAWWLQSQLLYMPSFGRVGESRHVGANPRGFKSPAEYGMRHEEVWINSGGGAADDGVPLHAWLVLQPGSAASRAPTLLFFHGNAGNIGYRLPNLRALCQASGCNIFILDYRGFGGSAGEPSEAGLIEDARAALEYLRTRGKQGEEDMTNADGSGGDSGAGLATIDISRIHLFGRSLGGAVALQLAALDHEHLTAAKSRGVPPSALPPPLAGVIVENSFTSLEDLVLVLAGRMGLLRPEAGSPEEAAAQAQAQAEAEAMAGAQAVAADERDDENGGRSRGSGVGVPRRSDIPIPAALATATVAVPPPVVPGGASDLSSSVVVESRARRLWRLFLFVVMTNRWDSVSAVRRMCPTTPLLFCSGLADELIPASHMARLHAEATRAHPQAPIARLRTLHTVERGTHNDTHIQGGMLYYRTIAEFFAASQRHRQEQMQTASAERAASSVAPL